jgi:type I phosphodiesterase/nucleotide pyrophosphatase
MFSMALDDAVLALQSLLDRLVRRVRLGPAPPRGGRRLLVVQIDGLARAVLEQALAEGRMPFVRRLLQRGESRLVPMFVGLPSSTPAFQMAAMYGVRPDIPGFHYHDKRRREDVYFPRAGDAAFIERAQASGRRGVLDGGASYGCVFTGGAAQNLFNFACLKRPTGASVLRALSASAVLLWVAVKSLVMTAMELGRAVLRLLADPVGEWRRGWKWLFMRIGLSVWVRELFTLAVGRDVYGGVPAIYVNYLDYDVFSHAYGPRHRRAMRSLRRLDRSIEALWRVCRRVPEHGYEMYILSDHGQALCTPFTHLTGGRRIERLLFEEFFTPGGAVEVTPMRPRGRRHLSSGIKAFRSGRAPGYFQRFFNYLEEGFPWVLGEMKEARERENVRVIAAGPNAFVYFLDSDTPLPIEAVEARWPGLAEELSRHPGVGYVLARAGEGGAVCFWRGKRYRLSADDHGPFTGREDAPLVVSAVHDLMAMPSAGDLVLYGIDAPHGHVSYIGEAGAHAGPSQEELHAFIVAPRASTVPPTIEHPIQLYEHLVAYQEAMREPA